MNTNVLIGLVIAILIIGGGFFLLSNDNLEDEVGDINVGQNPNGDNSPGTNYQTPAVVDTTPAAPTVRTADGASVSSSTAGVTGEVRPNGAATTYWYEYGETSGLGSKTSVQNVGSGFTFIQTPGFITGLKADTQYHYRLSAKNSFGTVNGNTFTFETNNDPRPTGSIPTVTTRSASGVTSQGVALNANVDPNGANTTYWFEYGKDINLGNLTGFTSAGSGTSAQSVSVSLNGIESGTKYYFRVNAQNQFGTVNGTILNFTTTGATTPPAATQPTVTTLAADKIEDDNADLNGRVNPNGAATTYWFEYSRDSLLGSLIGSGTPKQTLANDRTAKDVRTNITGLTADTKYFYRLVAQNEKGTVRGSIMSFTTDK